MEEKEKKIIQKESINIQLCIIIKMIQHIKTTNLNLCYLYTKKTKFNTEIRHYKPSRSSSFSPHLKLW